MQETPSWRIYPGDCRVVMGCRADETVDAVVTDPPYGTASSTKVQTHGGRSVEAFDIEWDREAPTGRLEDAARVLKPGGALVVFGDTKRTTDIWQDVEAAGVRPLQCFYWIKTNPPPQPRQNFQSAVEVAVFARKPGKVIHWGGGGATPNHHAAPIAAGNDRTEHPTQKPLALMRHLVRLVTPPGGLVLDPFAGSGTTICAAVLENRNAIGIELSEDYCRIARQRVESWENSDQARQGDLFGA